MINYPAFNSDNATSTDFHPELRLQLSCACACVLALACVCQYLRLCLCAGVAMPACSIHPAPSICPARPVRPFRTACVELCPSCACRALVPCLCCHVLVLSCACVPVLVCFLMCLCALVPSALSVPTDCTCSAWCGTCTGACAVCARLRACSSHASSYVCLGQCAFGMPALAASALS